MVSGRHAHTIREDVPKKKSAVKDIKAPRSALLMLSCALKFQRKQLPFLSLSLALSTTKYYYFFKTETKVLPHQLIKKKRIAQLINGKPGENQYKRRTEKLLTWQKNHNRTCARRQTLRLRNIHKPRHCHYAM